MTKCNNDYMVTDLTWTELYQEMVLGHITLEDFLSYMRHNHYSDYSEGYDAGYQQCHFERME